MLLVYISIFKNSTHTPVSESKLKHENYIHLTTHKKVYIYNGNKYNYIVRNQSFVAYYCSFCSIHVVVECFGRLYHYGSC